MPSKLKQINVRADDAMVELESRVRAAASAAIGLEMSQSDVYRLGLNELAKKYGVSSKEGAAQSTPPTTPQPTTPTRKRGRPRKAKG